MNKGLQEITETCSIKEFKYGVSDRGLIRIPCKQLMMDMVI